MAKRSKKRLPKRRSEESRAKSRLQSTDAVESGSKWNVLTTLKVLGFFGAIVVGILNVVWRELSETPTLVISFDYRYAREGDDPGAGWRLSKVGIGDAILKDFRVWVDGNRVGTWGAVKNALQLRQVNSSDPKAILTTEYSYPVIGIPMSGRTSTRIFWVRRPPEAIVQLDANSKRVRIEACYCSTVGYFLGRLGGALQRCWVKSNMDSPPVPANCYPDGTRFHER